MKDFIRFTLILAGLTIMTLVVHLSALSLLDLPLFDHLIVRSYALNLLLAIIILFGLIFAPTKLQNSLGFLFMLGSILKFIFFFVFFYPFYLEDGAISKTEFLAFFVPYAVCLTTETKLLINRLSRG